MRLLYRADGGHPVGTGHIFRAVRLLNALASAGDLAADLMVSHDPWALEKAATAPATLIPLPPRRDPSAIKPMLDAAPLLQRMAAERYDLVVIDMLDTPAEEMAALAATGVPVATFDDRGPGRMHASAVVNVLVEEPEPAALPASVRLYEGGPYVVLDPVFATVRGARRPDDIGPLRNVFVTLGGADAAGLSVKVAKALKTVPGLARVEFGCGPAFPHFTELNREVADAPWEHVVHTGLPGLLDRYLWSDLTVVAGGLTMYEVCCVGTPSLAVCQPLDHQFELAARLTAAGAMATAGYGEEASVEQIADAVSALEPPDARRRLSAAGPALVDGKGTERVAEVLIRVARD